MSVLLKDVSNRRVIARGESRGKTLERWMRDLADDITLGDVVSTFTSGDATPSVLDNSKFLTAGSTAITNFDDGVEGQTITIYRGASDIVITDNATIDPIISGNLSLTTARPSATFRLASGVWKQVEEAGAAATVMLPVIQATALGEAAREGSYVFRLETVALLQAATWSSADAPETIELSCRASLGDGGGGKFAFNSADSSTADDGVLTLVTASGRRYKRVIEDDCYCAAWWGSTFAALQLAVTAATTNSFPLFINPGTWTFAAGNQLTVAGSALIYGAGPATILQASADRTVPVIYINGASADNVKIRDLRVETTFSGTPTTDGYNCGIYAEAVDDCTIEDVEVEGRFYVGITYRDVSRATARGLRIRGARNRQLYLYEACFDISVTDCALDCRNSADAEYGDYGLNINPGGTDLPKRLAVNGVTVRGYTGHACSIAEAWEQATISNVSGETATATATGFLLQSANSKRGRKIAVTNVNFKGGLIGCYFFESDNWVATNILADSQTGAAALGTAGVRIQDCKNWVITGIQANDSAYDGVLVYGTAADLCVDGVIAGVAVEGCANHGISIVSGANANAVRRVTVTGINARSNTGTGVIADANSDRITFGIGESLGNTAAQVTNSANDGQIIAVGASGINLDSTLGTYKVDGTQVVGAQATAIANLVWTYSANDPATTPNSATTFADGTALVAATVYEALDEVEGKINAILAMLRTHGMIAT